MGSKNNIQRLKEEADISEVVNYCGLRKGKRCGNAQFVECPNPEHDDQHPTNAYYRDGWNTVYCTTCGKNMGAIDILMWNCGLEYGSAADVLWELEGRPDWYYADRTNLPAGEKTFTVSASELALLNVKFSPRVFIPLRESKFREEKELPKGYRYFFEKDHYILAEEKRVELCDFIPKSLLPRFVLKRCAAMKKRMAEIEEQLHAKDLFCEDLKKIQEIEARAKEAI